MKIEEISKIVNIEAIRGRMGVKADDTSMDADIEAASPRELVGLWSDWHTSYDGIGLRCVDMYEALKQLEKEEGNG